jgi:hypothetical protein
LICFSLTIAYYGGSDISRAFIAGDGSSPSRHGPTRPPSPYRRSLQSHRLQNLALGSINDVQLETLIEGHGARAGRHFRQGEVADLAVPALRRETLQRDPGPAAVFGKEKLRIWPFPR